MQFTVLRTLQDLDDLSESWNDLLLNSASDVPFLRHEYLKTWWRTLGGGEWAAGELFVPAAWENGRLTGLAPLFFTHNLEGDPALMLLGSIEISDYLDVIARPADLPRFIPGLLEFLNSSDAPPWKVLDLYNLQETSATLPLLQQSSKWCGWEFEVEQLQPSPYIPLPQDWETYLAGIDKKQRHEIRRKMRRAAEYSRPVNWYIVEDEAALDGEIEGFLELMEQDAEKKRFLTGVMRSQLRASVHAAFQAGWLQLAFITVGGKKAAGYLNFDYRNHIWVYNSGFSHDHREISPGWVLLGHLLQWSIEHGRHAFDFMRGSEDYKYRFGALNRFVVRAQVRR